VQIHDVHRQARVLCDALDQIDALRGGERRIRQHTKIDIAVGPRLPMRA